MVPLLVGCREYALVGSNHIVLQLAHRLELHSCNLGEGTARLAECILWGALQWLTILVEVRAEH